MKPEDVVERCLKDLAEGKATAADCQARFPEVRDLEAQLRSAQRLQAGLALTLRPEVLRRQEETLRRYVRVNYRPATPSPWLWRSALAACVMLLMVFGILNVSRHSLPGAPLYGLKRTMETVRLTFTPMSERTLTYLQLAEQRLTELEQLTQRGETNASLLTNVLIDLATTTEAAIASVSNFSPERQTVLWNTIVLETERQATVLAAIETALPATVTPALELTRQTASESHTLAVFHLTHAAPPASASATPLTPPTTTATLTWTPTRLPLSSPTPILLTATHVSTQPPSESPGLTNIPPTPTRISPAHTNVPPTHMPTRTRISPQPSNVPGGGGGGQPDCTGGNPNAPNYCTPTPLPPEPMLTPTACPTNPGGQPQCP